MISALIATNGYSVIRLKSSIANSMKEMRRFLLYGILCGLGLVSCSRYALIDKVPVEFKRPAKTIYAQSDATFDLKVPENLYPERLQIVSDSILVIMKQPDETSPFFSAYSSRTLQCLGSFLAKGRGPGESLSPNMAAVSASAPYLYVRDNSLMLSWEIDVVGSIHVDSVVFARTVPASDPGPVWLPVRDSLFFSYERKGKDLLYKVWTVSGEEYRSFSPFQGLNLARFFSQMSEIPTGDGDNGKLAFLMVFFPILHLLDVESGRWRAIAVDPDWRNWKTLLQEQISMDKMEYYAGATSSAEYIIALFQKHRIGRTMEAGARSEIHFFDWSGEFLYRILVEDNLAGLSFDSINSYLYGIERVAGRILRYDLSSILCI